MKKKLHSGQDIYICLIIGNEKYVSDSKQTWLSFYGDHEKGAYPDKLYVSTEDKLSNFLIKSFAKKDPIVLYVSDRFDFPPFGSRFYLLSLEKTILDPIPGTRLKGIEYDLSFATMKGEVKEQLLSLNDFVATSRKHSLRGKDSLHGGSVLSSENEVSIVEYMNPYTYLAFLTKQGKYYFSDRYPLYLTFTSNDLGNFKITLKLVNKKTRNVEKILVALDYSITNKRFILTSNMNQVSTIFSQKLPSSSIFVLACFEEVLTELSSLLSPEVVSYEVTKIEKNNSLLR